MGKNYRDMTEEEKKKHYEATEKYRKRNLEVSRKCSLIYYHNNKEKCAEKARLWREKNKDYIRDKQRVQKRERKLWAIDYLGGKCSSCGNTFHPAVYEFHHIIPEEKDRDPSKMLHFSLEKLTNELNKCVLLCANCHRLIHHKERY